MKLIPLMWAGLWRAPVRTALTVLSIVVAFALFGVLQNINASFDDAIDKARLDRLTVAPRFPGRGSAPLPLAYRDAIGRISGVTLVTTQNFVGGYYQDPKNKVFFNIVDQDWFAAFPEYEIPIEAREALAAKRDAVLVSRTMAQQYGWKVGDIVSLQSTIQRADRSTVWPFEVVAIVPDVDPDITLSPNGYALGNYTYFDESRTVNRGTSNRLTVRIADPSRSEELSQRIDALFASASVPTRTQSDRISAEMALENAINIKFVTNGVVIAVFFMLLFVTSNTMTQSARERIPEFAVLKTIGFSDAQAFSLVLGESLAMCVLGAVAGLGASKALMVGAAKAFPSQTAAIPMSLSVVVMGIVVTVLVAIVSGVQPAWHMKRLEIVDALAGR